MIHNSWLQYIIPDVNFQSETGDWLLFPSFSFLRLICFYVFWLACFACPALFIAHWKMWFNPSEPSIIPSTAFCWPLFSFYPNFNYVEEFGITILKKSTKCQHVRFYSLISTTHWRLRLQRQSLDKHVWWVVKKITKTAQSCARRAPTEGLLNCLPGCIIFIGGLFTHKAKWRRKFLPVIITFEPTDAKLSHGPHK